MFEFLQKYLCFGDGKKRSQSASGHARKRPVQESYSCKYCQKEFTSSQLYQVHKEHYCPSLAGAGSRYETSKKSVSKNSTNTYKPTSTASSKAEGNIRGQTQSGPQVAKSVNHSMEISKTMTSTTNSTTISRSPTVTADTPLEKEKDPMVLIKTADDEEIDKLLEEIESISPQLRVKKELEFITKNITKQTSCKYVVSEAWIESYTAYLNGHKKEAPGPLDNTLEKAPKTPKKDVYAVNEKIWKFIMKLYGGGPAIPQVNRAVTTTAQSDSDKYSQPRYVDKMTKSELGLKSYNSSMINSTPINTSFLKPAGLSNEMFYCYMNSSLQCLLGIQELVEYTYQEKYKKLLTSKNPKFWKAFNELVTLYTQSTSRLTPKAIRRIASVYFDPDEQHDSHEFLRYILSGMQDEVNLPKPKKVMEFKDGDSAWEHYKKYNVSIIDEMFAGQLSSKVTCKMCGHVSVAFDPFLDLSLPVIPDKTKNINDCLNTFLKEEEIRDSYACEKCKSKSRVTRKLSINRFPKILVIHLKRFQTFPKKKKISAYIDFPVETMKLTKNGDEGPSTHFYSLLGLVMHIGGVDSGHYVAYSKRGNEWYLCDDESVRKVSSKDVASKEAYVLIYGKKE